MDDFNAGELGPKGDDIERGKLRIGPIYEEIT
jgi:hypothetical protein